ncbi:MAG TPA: NCS2 family permease [Stenomitos sp.]
MSAQSTGVPPLSATPGWLDRWFRLSERGTTVRTELLAGLTTFLTMSYIIFVNPAILADAGIPKGAAVMATVLASVFCTTLFALWANLPIAVAPGMGLNAFFTYTVVLGQGLSWQTALGAVFISGSVFLILSLTGVRARMLEAVPEVLRTAIVVGIGCFIAFIGLKNAGIVTKSEATIVTLGHLTAPGPMLALGGLILATALMAWRVRGALVLSILAVTVGAMATGLSPVPHGLADVVSLKLPSLSETLFKLDIPAALRYGIVSIIFSFTIVELFDNLATLIGLSRKAGLMDAEGRIPNLNRALVADAVGTMASAAMGSTALNAYIENATGIAEGGRTGLKALVVAGLFLVSLLFIPLLTVIPTVATAPVLVLVGAHMLAEVRHLSVDDFTDLVPAFLTIVMMPLSFSIADGLAFGFVSYAALKLVTGRWREAPWMTYAIAVAFLVNFAFHG